jgi:DNA-binding MarR family transcriptional regulator
MIMANWCRRIERAGFVRHVRSDDRYWAYRHHEITDAGRALIRSGS